MFEQDFLLSHGIWSVVKLVFFGIKWNTPNWASDGSFSMMFIIGLFAGITIILMLFIYSLRETLVYVNFVH